MPHLYKVHCIIGGIDEIIEVNAHCIDCAEDEAMYLETTITHIEHIERG